MFLARLGSFLPVVLATSCASPSTPPEGAEPASLTVLVVADLHSHLFPERLVPSPEDAARGLGPQGRAASVGGAARLATLVERERERAAGPTILLDAGDLFEGSATYPLFGGVPEIQASSALGVDV